MKTRKSKSTASARAVLASDSTTAVTAAQAEAEKRQSSVVIAIVDDGGDPIVLRRLDDTQVASVQVSIDKARTAAIYRRPSKDFVTTVHTACGK